VAGSGRRLEPRPGLAKGWKKRQELIVAKIIEFYVPSTFRRNGKWIPPEQRGKVIEFVPETKKSA
jgi:hypothetical protein